MASREACSISAAVPGIGSDGSPEIVEEDEETTEAVAVETAVCVEAAVAVRAAEAGADAGATAVRRARVVLRWAEAAGARWGTVVVTTAPEDRGISKKLPEAGRVLAAVAVEGLFCRPDTAPVEAAAGAETVEVVGAVLVDTAF